MCYEMAKVVLMPLAVLLAVLLAMGASIGAFIDAECRSLPCQASWLG